MTQVQDAAEPSGPMKWFRVYSEMFSDTKIRRLPVAHRWCWLAMLSIASQSKPRGVCMIADKTPATIEDIADYANIPVDECAAAIAVFVKREMVREDDGFYVICNWGKRQFASDDVTARTSKAKQKNVPGNNAGTFPRTTQDRPTEYRVQSTENRPQKAEITAQNPERSVAIATGASAGEYDDFDDWDADLPPLPDPPKKPSAASYPQPVAATVDNEGEPVDNAEPTPVTAAEPTGTRCSAPKANATWSVVESFGQIVNADVSAWPTPEKRKYCGIVARMLKSYTADEITGCAAWMASNTFRRANGITLGNVEGGIRAWCDDGKPSTYQKPKTEAEPRRASYHRRFEDAPAIYEIAAGDH